MKIINKLLNYNSQWELPHVYLFTGNATIKSNGALVMGRGAAKQVRDTFKGIDGSFGIAIKARPDQRLHWVTINEMQIVPSTQHLGCFQVKRHYKDQACLGLIAQSTLALRKIAEKHPEYTFHMNFPGVGNGHLKFEDVEQIVWLLPDNVLLYLSQQEDQKNAA